MKRLQVVHFRSLKKPQEDEFCLELSMLHTYDEVVESVARHLGLDDPSKIRLTSHNCYSLQPKPQPIKYRGVGHLLDMLVHYNQTSDILYYEVLDIPLPELQELKTLKVSFHHSTKAEVVIHTIRLPKQSTVGDVFNDLKTKVELSHPNAELRLLEIFYHKIYKIFPLCEKIDNINDQYWTLRAEEIPEEEKNLGPHDRIIHVYHFTKETAQHPVQVENFGEPFFLVIRDGEKLAEVKVRIQTKLRVPDEEFSKWKFAFLSLGYPDYLQDLDIVSNRFQKRDVYGAWEQYLGLEHSNNSPKRSNAGNQVVERVPSESTRSVNGSHRDSKDETPEGNICAITRAGGHASNGQASDNAGGRNIVPSDDPALAAGIVSFLSYSVSFEVSLLLERIHTLHGGTFTRFSVTNRFMQTGVLESLASFIESMTTTKVNEMNEEALQLAANSVKDFELVGLDLSWLKQRLDEARRMNKRSDSLNDVISYETALIEALAKVRELEEGLAKAMAEAEILSKDFPESLGMNDCVLKGVL